MSVFRVLPLVLAAVLWTASAHAAEISFSAYTNGCLSSSPCTPVNTSANQTSTLDGLVFTNTSFSGTSVAGALDVNLGTFSLAAVSSGGAVVYNNDDFGLRVTFQMPTGIDGGATSVYSALLSGVVNSGSGGSVTVNFDNSFVPYTFTNGTSGSFSFRVNDLTINAGQSNIFLTGNITSATQGTTLPQDPSTVPEPASMLLLGTGLAGLAARRRLRRRG